MQAVVSVQCTADSIVIGVNDGATVALTGFIGSRPLQDAFNTAYRAWDTQCGGTARAPHYG